MSHQDSSPNHPFGKHLVYLIKRARTAAVNCQNKHALGGPLGAPPSHGV
jgi:hypothetical protein